MIEYNISLEGMINPQYMGILEKFAKYEFRSWLNEYKIEIKHTSYDNDIFIVKNVNFKFPDEQTLILFKLKWL